MNLNNLENLKEEMSNLGFDDHLKAKMEGFMEENHPYFQLRDQAKADKGTIDLTLHFKQSNQSDYYYLNRLEAVHNQAKPLEKDQHYLIIMPPEDGKSNSVKTLDSLNDALDIFKKREGNVELAVGKDVANKVMLANKENDKVNYIDNDFKKDYYSPTVAQTFWLDHGKGFTKDQAVNMMQGRSVYREDLLSREGNPYKAWMQLDFEKGKEPNGNFAYKQYTDAYGYDINKVLKDYHIHENKDPKKAELLESKLKNGFKPLVTVEKNGEKVKVFVETAVRYGKLNFYAENGRMEKREQFQKSNAHDRAVDNKSKHTDKKMANEQAIGR